MTVIPVQHPPDLPTRSTAVAVVLLLSLSLSALPAAEASHEGDDAYTYTTTSIPASEVDTTGWSQIGRGDDLLERITVDPVPFFGKLVTSVGISTNGFLVMGNHTSSSGCCGGGLIPDNDSIDGIIAGLWQDLGTHQCGDIYWRDDGDALRVAWVEVEYFGSDCVENGTRGPLGLPVLEQPENEGERATFHVSVDRTTGQIEIHLLRADGGHGTATTGIESVDGQAGNQTRRTAAALDAPLAWRFTPTGAVLLPGPDAPASLYTMHSTAPAAVDTSHWTTLDLQDDQVRPLYVSLPFYGQAIHEVGVSSNGFVHMDGAGGASGCCAGGKIPAADGVDGIIAAAWTDLDPSACGRVSYTSEEDVTRIAWEDVPYHGVSCSDPAGARVTAHVAIDVVSGDIEVHVLRADGNGAPMTTGIEARDASTGNETRRSAAPLSEPVAWRLEAAEPVVLPPPPPPAAFYVPESIDPVALDSQNWSATSFNGAMLLSVPTFGFYNEVHDNILIGSSGFVKPGDGPYGTTCCGGGTIPSADTPNGMIAALWSALDTDSCGTIRYAVEGDVVHVAWSDVGYAGSGCRDAAAAPLDLVLPRIEGQRVDARIMIDTATATIEVHVLRDDGGDQWSTTGIEAPDGTHGNMTRRAVEALDAPAAWRFVPHNVYVPEQQPEPEPVAPRVETFQFDGVFECAVRYANINMAEQCPGATRESHWFALDDGVARWRIELDWEQQGTFGMSAIAGDWQVPVNAWNAFEGSAPFVEAQDLDRSAPWQGDNQTARLNLSPGTDSGVVAGQAYRGCLVLVYGDAAEPSGSCLA